MPRAAFALPGRHQVKRMVQIFPAIPKIAGDAPHVRVGGNVRRVRHVRRPRRRAENNWATALVNRLADHLNFVRAVRHGKIIHLDEIQAPRCVKPHMESYQACPASLSRTPNMSGHQPQMLLVLAASAAVNVHPSIGVPYKHRLARNAAHHVETEFQAHRVNLVRERLETFAAARRRKAIRRRQHTAKFIGKQFCAVAFLVESRSSNEETLSYQRASITTYCQP